jgi:tetratricopeptide (TPR) repeat protein
VFAAVVGNLAAALEVGHKLLSWGQDHDDAAAVCLGHTALGGFSWILGDLATANRHLGSAVDVIDAGSLDHHPSLDPEVASGAWARSRHAQLAWLAGHDDEAKRLMADALRRAERAGKDSALIYAQCYDAWLAVFRRDHAHARRRAGETLARAEALHYRQHAVLARVLLAAASDDPLTRVTELERSIALWESTGTRLYTTCFLTLQAEAELEVQHTAQAAGLLARALGMVSDTGERFYEPEIHRLLGAVARRQGRLDQAEAHFSRGLEVAQNLGLVTFVRRLQASRQEVASAG